MVKFLKIQPSMVLLLMKPDTVNTVSICLTVTSLFILMIINKKYYKQGRQQSLYPFRSIKIKTLFRIFFRLWRLCVLLLKGQTQSSVTTGSPPLMTMTEPGIIMVSCTGC